MPMTTPTPLPPWDKETLPLMRRWLNSVRSMLVRIGVGILGASAYAVLVFMPTGIPFALGVGIFSCLGWNELYRAVKEKYGGEPTEFLGYVGCLVFEYGAWTQNGEGFTPRLPATLLLLVIVTLLTELVKPRPKPILNVGATLLGTVYIGWLFSYLTLLHSMNPHPSPILTPPIKGTTQGEWLTIFVTAATWLSDTGALFVGRGLGRNKLAPGISPQKTWEGSLGGLTLSVLCGLLLGWWLHLPLGHALLLSLLCGVAGQIGDLSESALKRDLGLKDFGTIFPEHGGVLDRIDSLLFAAPLAYYYVLFFLVKPH